MAVSLELHSNGKVIGLGDVEFDAELTPEKTLKLTSTQYFAGIITQAIKDDATRLLVSVTRTEIDPSYVIRGISYKIVTLNGDGRPVDEQLRPVFERTSVTKGSILMGDFEERARDTEIVKYPTRHGHSYVFTLSKK